MKKCAYMTAVILIGFSVSGSMNHQGQVDYTSSGMATGATAGAVMGGSISRTPEGALVGAALGAVTGGIIGNEMEEQNSRQNPQTSPMTLDEIQNLVSAGVSDEIIVSQIRASAGEYYLNSDDIIELKKNGVSEDIISYLINTLYTATTSSNTKNTAMRGYPTDTYIFSPFPHYVWVGGAWLWFDGHKTHPGLRRPVMYGMGGRRH